MGRSIEIIKTSPIADAHGLFSVQAVAVLDEPVVHQRSVGADFDFVCRAIRVAGHEP